MSLKIEQNNPEALRELLNRYGSGVQIAVGLPAGPSGGLRYPDGTPLLDVAYYNEFGTGSIPERPFIRAGVRSAQGELSSEAAKAIKRINSGDLDMATAAEAIGQKAAHAVSNYIVDLSSPENAESTKAAKGSSNPLVGKLGMLHQSITHEVR